MRIFALLFALLVTLNVLSAQEETSTPETEMHPQRWQLGHTFTDIVVPAITGELSFHLNHRHSIGVRASAPGIFPSGAGNYETQDYAYSVGIFHRFIFGAREDGHTFYFLKHGPRYSAGQLSFNKTDWFPIQEDGHEFLVYEQRNISDEIFRYGYTVSAGIQHIFQPFFLEYYVGLKYEKVINPEDLSFNTTRNELWPSSRWLHEGFTPVAGIIIGLGLKP